MPSLSSTFPFFCSCERANLNDLTNTFNICQIPKKCVHVIRRALEGMQMELITQAPFSYSIVKRTTQGRLLVVWHAVSGHAQPSQPALSDTKR